MQATKIRPELSVEEIISELRLIQIPDDTIPDSKVSSQCEGKEAVNEEPKLTKIANHESKLDSGCSAVEDNDVCSYRPELLTLTTEVVATAPADNNVSGDTNAVKDVLVLPDALSSNALKNLYIATLLDNLAVTEESILQEIRVDVHTIVQEDTRCSLDFDPFTKLLHEYSILCGQWCHAGKRFDKVLKETTELEQIIWNIDKISSRVSGKCYDNRKVYLNYEYEHASLSDLSCEELKETHDVTRWILFEEIPVLSQKLVICRNRIDKYLANLISKCTIYKDLVVSQPHKLIGPAIDPTVLSQVNKLRSVCTTLFAYARQFWLSQCSTGCERNNILFMKHLCNWLLLIAGTVMRVCRTEDHIYMMVQLLRLPSKILKLLIGLIQPPDLSLALNRSRSLMEFLRQPEVELMLCLFALCLQPVRERERFVTTHTNNLSVSDHSNTRENPWIVIDSGGESDTRDSLCNLNSGFHKEIDNQTNLYPPPHTINTSSNCASDAMKYVHPSDLKLIIGQLKLNELMALIYRDTSQSFTDCDNSAGQMTLLAFGDRVLQLIENCATISSDQLINTETNANLSAWRIMAKQLADLVKLLLTAIGTRISRVWYQSNLSIDERNRFNLVFAQYDALCVRAVNCVLTGCGLFKHNSQLQSIVSVTCWRKLANLIPIGLSASSVKIQIFHLLLKSILIDVNMQSMSLTQLPDLIINRLRTALLSSGLNQFGLSAFINALGKFATFECRPYLCVTQNPQEIYRHGHQEQWMHKSRETYDYELPESEKQLIQCVLRLIYGLSVHHVDSTMATTKASLPSKTMLSMLGKSSGNTLFFFPIATQTGQQQLIQLVITHPNVCLHLLLDLIHHTVCDLLKQAQTSSSHSHSIHKRDQLLVLNLCYITEQNKVQDLLIQLVQNSPFHLLQPTEIELDYLINSLCEVKPDCFAHKLYRTILERLAWDAYSDQQTTSPFIPYQYHLDLAFGLCKIVEKHLCLSGLSLVAKTMNTQLVSSTFNLVSNTMTGQLLSTIMPSNKCKQSTNSQRMIRASDYPYRRAKSVDNLNLIASDSALTSDGQLWQWSINLLLRLKLPGNETLHMPVKKYSQNHSCSAYNSDCLDRIWSKLFNLTHTSGISNKEKCIPNPVTAFLMLCLQTCQLNLLTDNNNSSNKWELKSSTINNLLNFIFHDLPSPKFGLRTLWVLFKHILPLEDLSLFDWPELNDAVWKILTFNKPRNTDGAGDTVTPTAAVATTTDHDDGIDNDYDDNLSKVFTGLCIDLYSMQEIITFKHLFSLLFSTLLNHSHCFTNRKSILLLDRLCLVEYWTRRQRQQHQPELKHLYLHCSKCFEEFEHLFQKLYNAYCTMSEHLSLTERLAASQLGTAAKWAWQQTVKAMQNFNGQLSMNSMMNSYTSTSSVKKCHFMHKSSLFNQYCAAILNTHISEAHTPPYWLLMWLQQTCYSEEKVNHLQTDSATNQIHADEDCGFRQMWRAIQPYITLYQDELITASQQPHQLSRYPDKSDNEVVLSTSMKRVLGKILVSSGIFSLQHATEDDPTEIAYDLTICHVFNQLSLVQGVHLIHSCPPNHPAYVILIHTILAQMLDLTDQCNRISHTPNSNMPHRGISPGLLLLRSLPSNLLNYGVLPVLGQQDCNQSMLQLIMHKLYYTMQSVEIGGKFFNDLKILTDFLNELDNFIAHSPFLSVQSSEFAYNQLLISTYQQSMIDRLLMHVNWTTVDQLVNEYHFLWTDSQFGCKSTPTFVSCEVNQLEISTPQLGVEASQPRVKAPQTTVSLLASVNSIQTLPKSIKDYPNFIKDATDRLRKVSKRICDRVKMIQKLQQDYCVNVVKLYKRTNVRRTERVECHSILPSWMPGYRPCLGGVKLTVDYTTWEPDEAIQSELEIYKSKLIGLHNLCIEELNDNVEVHWLPMKDSVTPNGLNESALSITSSSSNWLWPMLGLYHSVSHLVDLSNQHHIVDTPHSDMAALQEISLTCFKQLCQTLSGALLNCSLTKQIMVDRITELAEQFLTSVPGQCEFILDMLVALPHLSSVLVDSLVIEPPKVLTNEQRIMITDHPLCAIYGRLLDIKSRCGPLTALRLLEKINFKRWFSSSNILSIYPRKPLIELVKVICECIQQTTTNHASVEFEQSDELMDFQKLCLMHLKALLAYSYPTMVIQTLEELLIKDLTNYKLIKVWDLIFELISNDVETNCESIFSLQQLVTLFHEFAKQCSPCTSTKTVDHVKTDTPITSLCNLITQDDKRIADSYVEHFNAIVNLFNILFNEFSKKLHRIVCERHISLHDAVVTFMESIVNVYGLILCQIAIFYHKLKSANASKHHSLSPSHSSSSLSASLSKSTQLLSSEKPPVWKLLPLIEKCAHTIDQTLQLALQESDKFDFHQIWYNQLMNSWLNWLLMVDCQLDVLMAMKNLADTQTETRLITLICSFHTELETCQSSHNSCATHDPNTELASVTNCPNVLLPSLLQWVPYCDCLGTLVNLLINTRNKIDADCNQVLVKFVIQLLSHIDWSNNQLCTEVVRGNIEQWWLPIEALSTTDDADKTQRPVACAAVACGNAYTLLMWLLSRDILSTDDETKLLLSQIMENILSNLDLSIVQPACYQYVMSQINEQTIPITSVLMPPTTMEGRLFGLLAAAGGLMANASDPSNHVKLTTTKRFPDIVGHLQSDSETIRRISLTNPLHQKRLIYIRKLTNLLHDMMMRNQVPVLEMSHLFPNPINSTTDTTTTTTTNNVTSDKANWVVSSDQNIVNQSINSLIQCVRQPANSILYKLFGTELFTSREVLDCQTDAQPDPEIVFQTLICLRIGNLLSELEAVANQICWADFSGPSCNSRNCGDLVQLMIEFLNLIPRSIILLSGTNQSRKFKKLQHGVTVNSTNTLTQVNIPQLLVSAIGYWLLGPDVYHQLAITDMDVKQFQLWTIISNSRRIIIPHSIDAKLAMVICQSLLQMQPHHSLDSVTTMYLVKLLTASQWCLLIYAPSDVTPLERFLTLLNLFDRNLQQTTTTDDKCPSTVDSNVLIKACLKGADYLQIFCLTVFNLKSKMPDYVLIITELMQWLHVTNLTHLLDNTYQLNSWLLFVALIMKLMCSMKPVRCEFTVTDKNCRCCTNHPGWSSTPHTQDTSIDCVGESQCKRMISILLDLKCKLDRKSVAHCKNSQLNSDAKQKLHQFLDSLRMILTAWCVTTSTDGLNQLESCTNFHDTYERSDSDPQADEHFNYENMIATLLALIKSNTNLVHNNLLRVYEYLCTEIWPDLLVCTKQVLDRLATM